jgi:hypothetical protein
VTLTLQAYKVERYSMMGNRILSPKSWLPNLRPLVAEHLASLILIRLMDLTLALRIPLEALLRVVLCYLILTEQLTLTELDVRFQDHRHPEQPDLCYQKQPVLPQ